MRNVKYTVLLLAASAFLCGCESPQIPQVQRTRVIDGSFDATWKAVVATVAERSYPIQAIEKDSGILATGPIGLPSCGTREFSDLVVLPSVFLGVWRDPQCTLNFVVNAQGDTKTLLTVNSSIRIYEYNVTQAWHNAYSTGRIESTMLSAVEGRVKRE
jgi:hypothetical protein